MKTEECKDDLIVYQMNTGQKMIIIQYPVIDSGIRNFDLADCAWNHIGQRFPIADLKLIQE